MRRSGNGFRGESSASCTRDSKSSFRSSTPFNSPAPARPCTSINGFPPQRSRISRWSPTLIAHEARDFVSTHRPLRVMLLTRSIHYGGAERQVVELAKLLDRRRFEPLLCCLDGTRTLFDLNPSSTPIVMAKRRAKFDPIPFLQIGWLLRRRSIDVVHSFLFDAEVIGRLMG